MRALVYTRPGTVELLDIEQPTPDAGEVLVRVDAAGICGSELHGIADTSFRRPPLVMGHELRHHARRQARRREPAVELRRL